MSKPKKVAVITPVFPPYRGGIGTVALHHARVLGEQGLIVTVYTPDYGRGEFDVANYPFKLKAVTPLAKYGNAAWIPSMSRELKQYDTVLLQYPFFGGAGVVYRAKKKYGFKLLVSYNMDVVGSGLKGLIFSYNTSYFLPRLVERADVVIASSDDYARHSDLKKFWKDDPKYQVVPIGVDLNQFKPAQPDLEFKKNLRLAASEQIVLFVGGLDAAHYFKGVDYLIRAVALLKRHQNGYGLDSARVSESDASGVQQKYQILKQVQDDAQKQCFHDDDTESPGRPDSLIQPAISEDSAQDDVNYKVVIVGRGELQDHYRSLAEELGVKDCIMFAGGISDSYLVKLYQMATMTVLPSIDQSESFGIVLAESMACGTPVITSDLPGVRSVYENRVSGFTVPAKDAEKLAERISFMLDNPDTTQQMGKCAHEQAQQKYNWDSIGKKLYQLT